MKSSNTASLIEQRLALRQRLLAQRQIIAQKFGTTPAERSGYPRSVTMRFLTQRPDVAARLLSGLTNLLIGGRVVGAFTTALAVARMAQEAAAQSQQDSADNT